MTATRHTLYTPAPVALWHAGKEASSVLAQALRRCADAWRSHRQDRTALRDLREMSDQQLRDLGIDRSELASIALRPDDDTRIRFHRHL